MTTPLLQLHDVRVVRGGRLALDNVSLTIGVGENVAILGPNGCGKSTLVKLIDRELYPYAGQGSIRILGESRWDVAKLRTILGVVSNDLQASMYPHSTALNVVLAGFTGKLGNFYPDPPEKSADGRPAWELLSPDRSPKGAQEQSEVSIGGRPAWAMPGPDRSPKGAQEQSEGWSEAEPWLQDRANIEPCRGGTFPAPGKISPEETAARQALIDADAEHLTDRLFGELSSGEARRVMVARALAHNPPSLLLDEPTTSLDIVSASDLMATIRRLVRNGRGLLLVTHHFEEIVPEISRVVLLKGGKVFKDGPRREVMTSANLTELFERPVALRGDGPYAARICDED